MKLPRRKFLHLAAGAAALPAVSRIAWAQAYPARPVRIIVAFAAGGVDRHLRAADRPMAVGAAWPAIRHREPAGRGQQYRHRGGRACASRRLYAPRWSLRRTQSTRRSTTSSISISSATSRRSRASSARLCHGGQSISSGQDRSRVHRLCQGQSGQDQHGVGRHRNRAPRGRRAVQDDDRRQHGPCAVSRRGTRADRSARRTSAGLFRHLGRRRSSYIRAGKLRALAVTTATRSEALAGHPDDWLNSCRATRRALGSASARRRTRPPRSSRSSTRRSTRPLPIPRSRRGSPIWAARCFRARPSDFGKLIADETEKWGKVIRAANIKPE